MMEKITRDVRVERYFPAVVAPAKEFKAIATAENPEYTLLYEAAWKWFANTFIFGTDVAGLSRWEDMLGIFPAAGATVDDRRLEIYLRCNSGLPYTERAFANMLTDFFGYGKVVPLVNPDSYELALSIDDSMVDRIEAIRRYARLIVPANLSLVIAQTADLKSDFWEASGVLRIDTKRTLLYAGDYDTDRYDKETAAWLQAAIDENIGAGLCVVSVDLSAETCTLALTVGGGEKAAELVAYTSGMVPQLAVTVSFAGTASGVMNAAGRITTQRMDMTLTATEESNGTV